MPTSSEYTQVWTAETSSDAAENVGSSRSVADVGGTGGGPLTGAIEDSGWTTEDVMLAIQLANAGMFAVITYLALTEGGR